MQLPRKYPEAEHMRIRQSINVIAKALYFVHLVVNFIYSLMLIILKKKIRVSFNGALLLIIIYGFMIVWLNIINFVCVMIKKQMATKMALWCNRFIVKIILILFPLFASISYFHDYFLVDRSIITFMGYNSIVSVLLIIFEIYSCTCGHHEEPGFIYEPNQLGVYEEEVNNVMKEVKIKKRQSLEKKKSNPS